MAQKDIKKKQPPKKSRMVDSQRQLDNAKRIREKSPTQAIRLLEQVISSTSKRKDLQTQGKAYALLGNIYEDIGQADLAIERNLQAVELLGSFNEGNELAEVYQRLGQLYLEQKNDQEAEKSFRYCIGIARDPAIGQLCEEGLVDVELFRKNPEKAFEQLDYVQLNFAIDSVSNARLEARRSQAYLFNNDFSRASQSYLNSMNSLPSSAEVDRNTFAPIERAQISLLNFDNLEPAEEINLLQSQVQFSNLFAENNSLFIQDNLRIAELFEKKDNLSEAEKFIENSKDVIRENTPASTVADVYKKSAEINERKGEYEAALKDFRLYTVAKEEAIEELERKLSEQVEIVKGQKSIDDQQQGYFLEEKDRALFESQLRTQRITIGLLSVLLLSVLGFFYFLYKSIREKRRANQLLLLKSLRTQMNPHFIFNALNSVNNFIAKNDEKAANKFLSDFSKLMRKVLDHSQKDFTTFEEELELNELYLKLEHFRFRDRFEYDFKRDLSGKILDLEIPPMLIQPFIENAVWHGLRYKAEKGYLNVTISELQQEVLIIIEDNGIGRAKSRALKTKNQKKYTSTGLNNVSKRLEMINQVYQKKYTVTVSDLNVDAEDQGTKVEIKIPKH